MRVIATLMIAILFLVYFTDSSITPDKDLTTNLQKTWGNNDFVIAISNIKSKKKSSEATVETLLAIKYGKFRTKIVLVLDRRAKRVILESIDENGHRIAEHINVDTLNANSPLKNIIVIVHQSQSEARLDVYIDCVYQGVVSLNKSFRKLALNKDNSRIEAFRKRRSQIKVYPLSSTIDVLRQENCPNNLADMDALSDFFQHKESHESTAKPIDDQLYNDFDEFLSNIDRTRLKSRNKQNYHPRSKGHVYDFTTEKSNVFENIDQFDDVKQSDRSNRDHYSQQGSSNRHEKRINEEDRSKYRSVSDSNADEADLSGYETRLHQWTRSGYFNRPVRTKFGEFNNSDESDVLIHANSNYKRIPRRGDMEIQSLDERVCQTDSQIVKTLNELIEATRKVFREIELNRAETKHLRQLIENCAACRVPPGE